jgi:hypothetical protein
MDLRFEILNDFEVKSSRLSFDKLDGGSELKEK